MPGLDIAVTWLTEFVADEVVIPIVGAGLLNVGRSVYKRIRRKPGESEDALSREEAKIPEFKDLADSGAITSRDGAIVASSPTPVTSPAMTSPATTSPVMTSPAMTSPAMTSPVTTSPVNTSPVTTSPLTSGSLAPGSLTSSAPTVPDPLVQLEYRRFRSQLLLKRVQISRLQQDRLTWLIWSSGFGWSVYAALTPLSAGNFTNPKLGLLLFLVANFIMGLVRIAVDASLLKSLQVELEASQHQLDLLDPHLRS